ESESCCSTPYVSAPSSPCRAAAPFAGFYYSAPSSPTHFVLTTTTNLASYNAGDVNSSFEFDFSATCPGSGASSPGTMTSADELFFNGQIRPMKLSTHLQRPQTLSPLIESSDNVGEEDQSFSRGREMKLRAGSLRRRTRSMSPLRNTEIWQDDAVGDERHEISSHQIDADPSASRSSSGGRSSGRWEFLKDFLYRSKSEGRNRNEGHKFWRSISFSPIKDKKQPSATRDLKTAAANKKTSGKRRVPPPSPHQVHYAAKRAQAEEMKKRTFLPYRQGLLSCIGFSSRSYTAMAGIGR
ncbi:hypothetical protein M569_10875, partial [Genlisea aurea]